MVTHEIISKLQELKLLNQLVVCGVVPANWVTYKEIYDYYVFERKRLMEKLSSQQRAKSQSVTNTAEKFDMSSDSIYRIVRIMKN